LYENANVNILNYTINHQELQNRHGSRNGFGIFPIPILLFLLVHGSLSEKLFLLPYSTSLPAEGTTVTEFIWLPRNCSNQIYYYLTYLIEAKMVQIDYYYKVSFEF
jgi:hypothetical protein